MRHQQRSFSTLLESLFCALKFVYFRPYGLFYLPSQREIEYIMRGPKELLQQKAALRQNVSLSFEYDELNLREHTY